MVQNPCVRIKHIYGLNSSSATQILFRSTPDTCYHRRRQHHFHVYWWALSPSKHIWMGVSIENQKYLSRIDHLRRTHARVKFLSIEPLLGPLSKLQLRGIDWVIVGGESGPGARPMNPEWVSDIRDQCQKAGVAFFFKQWGGVQKKKTGRTLDGQTWDEMPSQLVAIA